MATRRQTEQRKAELKQELREACRSGALSEGSLLPSIRELAAQHSLSSILVRQVIQSLEEDGVLYTIPRVGTFVGRQVTSASEFYLLFLPKGTPVDARFIQVKTGFEERIAHLGGASLVLTRDVIPQYQHPNHLPVLAGLFDFDEDPFPTTMIPIQPGTPYVRFAGDKHYAEGIDLVSFDDADGGRRATQHLLQLGHRKIAFLALHPVQGDPGMFAWSAEREAGWREALLREYLNPDGLAYHVTVTGAFEQRQAAYEAAEALVHRTDVTAVVTANDQAAWGLLEALRDAHIPLEHWPAIVGFDDDPGLAGLNVSSYRLPWDEVGRAAASLLWERRHGQQTALPVHQQIPMRLIQRFTSHANWSVQTGHATFVAP